VSDETDRKDLVDGEEGCELTVMRQKNDDFVSDGPTDESELEVLKSQEGNESKFTIEFGGKVALPQGNGTEPDPEIIKGIEVPDALTAIDFLFDCSEEDEVL
jgi:hypothetical protein